MNSMTSCLSFFFIFCLSPCLGADEGSVHIHIKFAKDHDMLPDAAKQSFESIRSLFSLPRKNLDALRHRGNEKTKRKLPHLSRWYDAVLKDGVDIQATMDLLESLPNVEHVEHITEASLPLFGGGGSGNNHDYSSQQGYLAPAPSGTDNEYAWSLAGGDGSGITIYDIEWAWDYDHKDLKKLNNECLVLEETEPISRLDGHKDHGTAVVGVMVGDPNSYGVTGASFGANIKVVPTETVLHGFNSANAIALATNDASPGDIILIEIHSGICGVYGDFGPMEYFQSTFDAVSTATANGIVVVAAAGNGNLDLDSPECLGRFDRNIRDSGAIIVGASVAGTRHKVYFSSYGSRVDVHGWGTDVMTTGYGDYKNRVRRNDRTQWYTPSFSGTSSASPIVASAAAIMQSISIQNTGSPMDPITLRASLAENGSPQEGHGGYIGPLPNLRETLNNLFGCMVRCNTPVAVDNTFSVSFDIQPGASDACSSSSTVTIQNLSYTLRGTLSFLSSIWHRFGHAKISGDSVTVSRSFGIGIEASWDVTVNSDGESKTARCGVKIP